MSAKALIVEWEEALAAALSQPGDQEDAVTEMRDGDLTDVADLRVARLRVQSHVHAGLGGWTQGLSSTTGLGCYC